MGTKGGNRVQCDSSDWPWSVPDDGGAFAASLKRVTYPANCLASELIRYYGWSKKLVLCEDLRLAEFCVVWFVFGFCSLVFMFVLVVLFCVSFCCCLCFGCFSLVWLLFVFYFGTVMPSQDCVLGPLSVRPLVAHLLTKMDEVQCIIT